MKAAIFCQGSSEIGLGHITRCLAIAREFKRRKVELEFFVNNHPVCIEKIRLHGFPYQTFLEKEEVSRLLRSSGADFVLSDCNEATRSEILAINEILPVFNIAAQGPSSRPAVLTGAVGVLRLALWLSGSWLVLVTVPNLVTGEGRQTPPLD